MKAGWVVPVGVFPGIEQQPHDLNVPKLGRQSQCPMPVLRFRAWQEPQRFVSESHPCRRSDVVNPRAMLQALSHVKYT